jgi:hypothetical protein
MNCVERFTNSVQLSWEGAFSSVFGKYPQGNKSMTGNFLRINTESDGVEREQKESRVFRKAARLFHSHQTDLEVSSRDDSQNDATILLSLLLHS